MNPSPLTNSIAQPNSNFANAKHLIYVLQLQPNPGSNQTVGVAALIARGQYPYDYWYWLGLGALLGLTILYNVGFTFALGYMPGNLSPILTKFFSLTYDMLPDWIAMLSAPNG